jgi:sterol desaturase/sphingolipid hydroxylase (fatty acid hydroxylase superfamily)
MLQWLSSLSKHARVGLLISAVWIIVITVLGMSPGAYFAGIVLLFGVLPVVIGWGIRYVRRASQ